MEKAMNDSASARTLAAKLAPHAREYLHRVGPSIHDSCNMVERAAYNHIVPRIEADMENLLEKLLVLVLERAGSFSVSDLAAKLAEMNL